ncbi:unnamed protein product [Durusdinium trenchii]|uniref:Uncharacterized protein n=2 Tax=Durusdinium trenchii TaxID=1381693 RepID=A0ABP0R509_9DINO
MLQARDEQLRCHGHFTAEVLPRRVGPNPTSHGARETRSAEQRSGEPTLGRSSVVRLCYLPDRSVGHHVLRPT